MITGDSGQNAKERRIWGSNSSSWWKSVLRSGKSIYGKFHDGKPVTNGTDTAIR